MATGDQTDPVLIKQNDTRPKIRAQAKQGPGGATTVDLTGASVVFNMRLAADPFTVVASRVGASLVTPSTGIMEFTPTTAQTATNGLYQAEFEVTFADGGVLTFPSGANYIWIQVGDDIA